ncbi:M23 family metallopeptidase [Dokdonia sp. Asnod2-E02]|uniref:M23 family metallopeptidase n=1 Tax=Dokdonia sp. Asnod2-E02 TaxID=3160574 RepID=UPI0038676EB8
MHRVFIFIFVLINVSCNSTKLPTERFSQYEYFKSYSFENNNLKIELKNPLHCPLRVWLFNDDNELQNRFNQLNPIELNSTSDTLIVLPKVNQTNSDIKFSSRLGSVAKNIEEIKLELPFPNKKEYKIIQGNNTNYTHSTDYSRYAIDFDLKTNDTICSATSGFVVGVVDKYKHGGKGDQWKPYGNYVTIYEPQSGLFTQYVHLVKNGSLVKVGDEVISGQPIALSGKTGQTDIEHLHFNCLIPVNSNDGLKSIPFEFIEGYKSKNLKKNDIVRK